MTESVVTSNMIKIIMATNKVLRKLMHGETPPIPKVSYIMLSYRYLTTLLCISAMVM